MRITSIVASGILLLVAGCTSIRHHPRALEHVGTALPVEVTVRPNDDDPVSGVVHYRTSASGSFATVSMQHRAGQLYVILPTSDLAPEDTVEYYIDVEKDGKGYALGSPAAPYRTRFLDRTQMVIAGLRAVVHASTSKKNVEIILQTNGADVDQPFVEYCVPGVPGVVRVPMDPASWGAYSITVPARAVTHGTWRYAIEVPFDGAVHRLPRQGFGTFVVKEVREQQHPIERVGAVIEDVTRPTDDH